MNCYIHPKKTTAHNCSECSKAICHECTFQEAVASRVTRYSSYNREVETDFAFFCPDCFLGYANKKGYDKSSKGVFFRFKSGMSILGVSVLWGFFIGGFIINFFFPIGYVLWIGTIVAMISLKISANRNYDKYLKALRLTGKLVYEDPSAKKRRDATLCPRCETSNLKGSEFCSSCGSKL